MQVQFQEDQRFTQWWVWLILIGVSVFPILALINGNLESGTGAIAVLLPVSLLILFRVMRMTTRIDNHGISMRFIPFVKKKIDWDDVEAFKVINYGFVGGWGIRIGTRYGTVYNVRGNQGLLLKLKKGKQMVIGTSRPDELKEQLENIDLENLTV